MPRGQKRTPEELVNAEIQKKQESIAVHKRQVAQLEAEIKELLYPPATWEDAQEAMEAAGITPDDAVKYAKRIAKLRATASAKAAQGEAAPEEGQEDQTE